jgi:hypothetical protein
MDYKAFSAYLDEDAAYQATLKNHQELWSGVRSAEVEVRSALRRVNRLMLAVDVVRQQQFKFEELPEEQDKILEEFTTDSGEVWYCQYDQAADDVEEAAVAACAMVIEKRAKVTAKKTEAQEHGSLLNYAREQAREVFIKQQEEAKASA